jgi:hypothetical protein
MRPLCDGTLQSYAKAYASHRPLQVLKDYGANSVVASICPKDVAADPTDPVYGYNPAAAALIGRVKETLGDSCLSEALPIDQCQLVEATWPGFEVACEAASGRAPVDASLGDAARAWLAEYDLCDGAGTACADLSLCTILPASDTQACSTDPSNQAARGYCTIDAPANCAPGAQRTLRVVGPPAPGSTLLLVCPE